MGTKAYIVVSEIDFWDKHNTISKELDRRFISIDELCDMITNPNEVSKADGDSFLFTIKMPPEHYWVNGIKYEPHFYALHINPFNDTLGNPCWIVTDLDIDYHPRQNNQLLYECKCKYDFDN